MNSECNSFIVISVLLLILLIPSLVTSSSPSLAEGREFGDLDGDYELLLCEGSTSTEWANEPAPLELESKNGDRSQLGPKSSVELPKQDPGDDWSRLVHELQLDQMSVPLSHQEGHLNLRQQAPFNKSPSKQAQGRKRTNRSVKQPENGTSLVELETYTTWRELIKDKDYLEDPTLRHRILPKEQRKLSKYVRLLKIYHMLGEVDFERLFEGMSIKETFKMTAHNNMQAFEEYAAEHGVKIDWDKFTNPGCFARKVEEQKAQLSSHMDLHDQKAQQTGKDSPKQIVIHYASCQELIDHEADVKGIGRQDNFSAKDCKMLYYYNQILEVYHCQFENKADFIKLFGDMVPSFVADLFGTSQRSQELLQRHAKSRRMSITFEASTERYHTSQIVCIQESKRPRVQTSVSKMNHEFCKDVLANSTEIFAIDASGLGPEDYKKIALYRRILMIYSMFETKEDFEKIFGMVETQMTSRLFFHARNRNERLNEHAALYDLQITFDESRQLYRTSPIVSNP